MVSRRSYIIGGIGSASVLWYGLTQHSFNQNDADNTNNKINEITKKGTSTGTTNGFTIPDNTTLSEIHVSITPKEYSEIFLMEEDQTAVKQLIATSKVTETPQMNIEKLQNKRYTLSIKGGVDDWSVKIRNYKSLPDDTQTKNIPMNKSGEGSKVYGPIVIGPYPPTVIECETKSASTNPTKLQLIQAEPNLETADIITIPPNESTRKQFIGRLDGVGFVQILSDTDWIFTVKRHPKYLEQKENGTYEPISIED